MNSTQGFEPSDRGSELSVWDEVIKFKWTPAWTVCMFLDSANYAAVLAMVVPMNNFLRCCYYGWRGIGLVKHCLETWPTCQTFHPRPTQSTPPTSPRTLLYSTLLYIPEIKILNIRYLFYIVSRLIRLDGGQHTVTHSGYTEQIGCPAFYLWSKSTKFAS